MRCEEFIDVFKEEKTGIARRRREGWTKSLEQARATGKRFGRRIGDKLEADISNALKRGDKGILRLADEFRVRPNNRSENQARTAGGSEMSGGDTGLTKLMRRLRIPVTRENYPELAYIGDAPKDLGKGSRNRKGTGRGGEIFDDSNTTRTLALSNMKHRCFSGVIVGGIAPARARALMPSRVSGAAQWPSASTDRGVTYQPRFGFRLKLMPV